MMAAVHALMGAALGGASQSPLAAIPLGVASHVLGDLTPHREVTGRVDLALTALALLYISKRFGPASPQMVGALAGMVPDAEHGLVRAGIIQRQQRIIPTHNNKLPHPSSPSYLSQVFMGVASLACLEFSEKCCALRQQPLKSERTNRDSMPVDGFPLPEG